MLSSLLVLSGNIDWLIWNIVEYDYDYDPGSVFMSGRLIRRHEAIPTHLSWTTCQGSFQTNAAKTFRNIPRGFWEWRSGSLLGLPYPARMRFSCGALSYVTIRQDAISILWYFVTYHVSYNNTRTKSCRRQVDFSIDKIKLRRKFELCPDAS